MVNIIVIWSGEIVDIPAGWALCDGNNGTPDLRNKVLVGAGDAKAPHDEGTSTMTANANWPWYALAFIMKVP